MLSEQMDDFIQLFVVAVAVHKNFKLRVASFGFSGLYVHKVDVVFLKEKTIIFFKLPPFSHYDKLIFLWYKYEGYRFKNVIL